MTHPFTSTTQWVSIFTSDGLCVVTHPIYDTCTHRWGCMHTSFQDVVADAWLYCKAFVLIGRAAVDKLSALSENTIITFSQSLLLSNQQSKTQRLFIYCGKSQKSNTSSHLRSRNQQMFHVCLTNDWNNSLIVKSVVFLKINQWKSSWLRKLYNFVLEWAAEGGILYQHGQMCNSDCVNRIAQHSKTKLLVSQCEESGFGRMSSMTGATWTGQKHRIQKSSVPFTQML